MRLFPIPILFLTLLLSSAVPSASSATEGALEINHACASGPGCFPGDDPGYPVDINERGSYRLTSVLTLPDANTDGIRILEDGVTIDLAGFGILGPVTCSNLTCSGGGSGFGVLSIAFAKNAFHLSNGFIHGAGHSGIYASDGRATITDVTVRESRFFGVFAGPHSILQRVTAIDNGGIGISLGSIASSVHDSIANFNGSHGIRTGGGAIIRSCLAENNGGDGFVLVPPLTSPQGGVILENSAARANAGRGASGRSNVRVRNSVFEANTGGGLEFEDKSVITGNTVSGGAFGILAGTFARIEGNQVSETTGAGIEVSTSSHVADNTSNAHDGDGILTGNASTIRDNSANSNGGDGIEAGTGSNVRGNTARSNAGFGLRAESLRVRFSDNSFTNNNGSESSAQTSSGFDAGGNLCNTTLGCP